MTAFTSVLDQAYRVAVEAALEAGRILRWHFQRGLEIRYKGEIDLVTEADLASEQAVLARIQSAFPDHRVLAEESGGTDRDSPWLWVVDPLDGTTNFAHGFPVFAVSIAVLHEGQRELAVVYDVMRDELFAARRGEGAFLNGRPIRVTRTPRLEAALLVTGFPYDRQESPLDNTREFIALLKRCHGVLRVGSAALDLASVAAGRLDGLGVPVKPLGSGGGGFAGGGGRWARYHPPGGSTAAAGHRDRGHQWPDPYGASGGSGQVSGGHRVGFSSAVLEEIVHPSERGISPPGWGPNEAGPEPVEKPRRSGRPLDKIDISVMIISGTSNRSVRGMF